MKRSLSSLGEFGLIKRFISKLSRRNSNILIGPGDDCAVVKPTRRPILLTTDMMIEGIHFRRDWADPHQIGIKTMRVNLSDIASMGGKPLYTLISVGLPKSFKLSEVDRLFSGMHQAAREEGVSIVGGDTNCSDRLVINVAVIGEGGKKVLPRSGAKVGDNLYVTGNLGASALGLEALKRGKKSRFEKFIRRHLEPLRRVAVGQRLSSLRGIHSLIDISDGLVSDLGHILEASGVGAEVFVDDIPIEKSFEKSARSLGVNPLTFKLGGGEDYELLFTASPRVKVPDKIGGVPVTGIGKILPRGSGLKLIYRQGRPLSRLFTGFRHF